MPARPRRQPPFRRPLGLPLLRPAALALVAAAATCCCSGGLSLRHLLDVPPAGLAAAAPPQPPPATSEAIAERCDTLRAQVLKKSMPKVLRWEKAATEGRTILGFGNQASKMLNRTLDKFDKEVRSVWGEESVQCATERQVVDAMLRQQLYSIFLTQRSIVEQALYQRLRKDLLKRMRRKRRELDVKEKLRMLHASMNEYDASVRELQPFFIDNPERDRAERRLSELQWGIADTPEGKDMQQKWKMDRMRRMPMRQSKGLSISLSPGMRLMFRPSGFGNLQINSRRQVGPPHNPNEVSMGLLNDGDVMDVYNKQNKPPLIKFQPTVGIDVSTG